MDSGDYDPEILPQNIPPEHKYQIFRKETVDKRGGGGGGGGELSLWLSQAYWLKNVWILTLIGN